MKSSSRNIILSKIEYDLNWSTAYFSVPRFGHVTSNLTKSINAWIWNIRNLAPFGILLSIYRKIISNIKNMQISFSMLGELTLPSKFSKKLEKLKELGSGLKIVPSALKNIFEVQK